MGQKTNDPQIITTGSIKENAAGGEIITFTIRLALFELACIVNVPGDGQHEAPVYVKFKTRFPQARTNNGFYHENEAEAD